MLYLGPRIFRNVAWPSLIRNLQTIRQEASKIRSHKLSYVLFAKTNIYHKP